MRFTTARFLVIGSSHRLAINAPQIDPAPRRLDVVSHRTVYVQKYVSIYVHTDAPHTCMYARMHWSATAPRVISLRMPIKYQRFLAPFPNTQAPSPLDSLNWNQLVVGLDRFDPKRKLAALGSQSLSSSVSRPGTSAPGHKQSHAKDRLVRCCLCSMYVCKYV